MTQLVRVDCPDCRRTAYSCPGESRHDERCGSPVSISYPPPYADELYVGCEDGHVLLATTDVAKAVAFVDEQCRTARLHFHTATTPDECAAYRERYVAGTDRPIPGCRICDCQTCHGAGEITQQA